MVWKSTFKTRRIIGNYSQKISKVIKIDVKFRRFEEIEYLQAFCLTNLGGSHLAEALEKYRKLLEIDPCNLNSLLGASEVMIQLKNWAGAAIYADKCLSINHKDHRAMAARGWIYFNERDLSSALKLITEANDLHRDASSLYKLGRINWELGGDCLNN